jgi:carboxymethylenebutenolidase
MACRWVEIGAGPVKSRAYVAVPGKGAGPGILLFSDSAGLDRDVTSLADLLGEEGYVVLAVDNAKSDGPESVAALKKLPELKGKIGALGFGEGGTSAAEEAGRGDLACAVVYYGVGAPGKAACPTVYHFAEDALDIFERVRGGFPEMEAFLYRGAKAGFAAPDGVLYDKSSSELAYTRSLALFRRVLGPRYDLDRIWDRHTELEFAVRAAEETMTTMIAEPYVNHVPVMTGGTGYAQTLRFYKHHFIQTAPRDSRLVPISRTIGADRVVDEMLFCFTHDVEIDWMLPGIAPTGRHVEIPLVAIVRFRGDKIHSEHIYWDQASVLVQIGVLDPQLYPVAGVETARKAYDEHQPSNGLMARWHESEKKAAAH